MSEFLNMDGYGAYVWPAYFASALTLSGLAFAIWRRGRALDRKLGRISRKPDRN